MSVSTDTVCWNVRRKRVDAAAVADVWSANMPVVGPDPDPAAAAVVRLVEPGVGERKGDVIMLPNALIYLPVLPSPCGVLLDAAGM